MDRKKSYGPRSALTSFLKDHGISKKMLEERLHRNTQGSETVNPEEQAQDQPQAEPNIVTRSRASNSSANSTVSPEEQSNNPTLDSATSTTKQAKPKSTAKQEINQSTKSEAISNNSSKGTKASKGSSSKKKTKKSGYESEDPEPSKNSRKKTKNDIPSSSKDLAVGFDTGSARKGGKFMICEMCGVKVISRRAVIIGNATYCLPCSKSIEKANTPTVKRNQNVPIDITKSKKYSKKSFQKKVIKSADGLLEIDTGIPSLQDLCVRILGQYIDMIESFGDLSANSLNKLCRIISKKRMLSQDNLKLFLGTDKTSISLYDCTYLDTTSFLNIAQFSPNLEELDLCFCGKINDQVIKFYAEHLKSLSSIRLNGPFLVSDDAFSYFFSNINSMLRSFKVSDAQFGVSAVKSLINHCNNLLELSVERCHCFTNDSVNAISSYNPELKATESLSQASSSSNLDNLLPSPCRFPILKALCIIEPPKPISSESLIHLIKSVGPTLEELRITYCEGADDTFLLDGIAKHCKNLLILDLTGCKVTSDGLCEFFQNSQSILEFDGTIAKPDTTFEYSKGLIHLGLGKIYELSDKALYFALKHSFHTLEYLSIHSATRNLTPDGLKAIAGIFSQEILSNNSPSTNKFSQDETYDSSDEDQELDSSHNQKAADSDEISKLNSKTFSSCQKLEVLDLSFVRSADNDILSQIVESCPQLRLIYVNGVPNVNSQAPKRSGLKILGRESDTL
ncbi:hypothetical protein BB560_000150 [Smittium megazygosporum]|uniref:RNI-like protein n=1 Tax=Smittium megazygosporum TaxID=133381 RepID=A0A2T9ZL95_9FUNG|nr:hypothetical protein BB560_000150 [Smittium megazygosporum]